MFCIHDFIQINSLDDFIICLKCGKRIKYRRLDKRERRIWEKCQKELIQEQNSERNRSCLEK